MKRAILLATLVALPAAAQWRVPGGGGTPGPAGPTGPTGPTGPSGPQGSQGIQGLPGNDGAQGPSGPSGPSGPQGAPGTTSWAGITDKPATFPATTPVATASALAADGADCVGAGEFAKGVNASGVASGCAVPPGTYSLPALGISTLGGVKGRAATSLTCASTDKVTGFDAAGAMLCGADVTGGGTDLSAEPFVTSATSTNLSAERVLSAGTNTTIDTATAGQIKVNVATGAGYVLPSAAAGALGGVELDTDLGGTAAAPQVVATHLAAALPGAQGGVGVALPTCSGTDKLTANGTQVSCATDQTSAGGSLDCVQEVVYYPAALSTGVTVPTFSTVPCQATTNMPAIGNRGNPAIFDMDRYTHCKAVVVGGNAAGQTGTVTVELRDYTNSTSHGSVTWNAAGCAARAYTTQDLTAKTGLVALGVRIGDSVTTDDPQIAPISVLCCNGSF